MKMNCYTLHDTSAPGEELLTSIFRFSHLLIRRLVKGLCPNKDIFSTCSIDIYHYVVQNGSTSQHKLVGSIFRFSHLLIR